MIDIGACRQIIAKGLIRFMAIRIGNSFPASRFRYFAGMQHDTLQRLRHSPPINGGRVAQRIKTAGP